MPSVLIGYADSRELVLGKSVEDNLNVILEHLHREPHNIDGLKFRSQLISSCAVALNGLGKIKDPVRLFQNLGLAFESRGQCIYTNTVRNAFNRLYSDAIKQGKQKEVFKVWKNFKNPLTKANAGKFVPLHELKALLDYRNASVREYAARVLAARKDFPLSALTEANAGKFVPLHELKALLKYPDSSVRADTVHALAARKDFPLSELKALLRHRDRHIRMAAAHALAARRDFPFSKFKVLLKHENEDVRLGATRALEVRLTSLWTHQGVDVRGRVANLLQTSDHPLKGIHGKRGQRKRKMRKLTRNLRV
jgi:hypothetical protein